MKQRLIIGTIIALIIIVVLALTAPWKANAPDPHDEGSNGTQTLKGTVACLPKPGDGPHTLECSLGLKVQEKYYALKNNPQQDLPVNQRVKVTGKITPPGPDEIYDIVGTMNVETLENIE